jgi:hypothetical protein
MRVMSFGGWVRMMVGTTGGFSIGGTIVVHGEKAGAPEPLAFVSVSSNRTS